MKRFRELREELLNEGGGDMMPADEMTMSELKIACFAANNILERLEGGAMIQRWQISAIVKAKEELASVYTSISADEMDMDDMDAYDDMEDEEEPMYVGFEYPSMYGEATEVGKAGPAKLVSYGPKGDKVTASKIAGHIAKRANDYTGGNAELVKKLSSEVAKHGDTTANELIGKHKTIAKNIGMDAKAAHNLISGAASALKEEVELDEISNDMKKRYLAKAKDDVADRKKTISQANKMKNASRRNFHSHSLWMDVAYKNQDKNDSRKDMMQKAKDSMKKKPVQEDINLDEAMYVKTTPGQLEKAADKVGATWDKEKNAYIKNGLQVGYTKLKSKPGEARSYDHFIHSKLKEEVELDEASYRDIGAQNMMRASRKADKEVDKMRAQAAKRAEKEAAKKKPVEEETDYKVTVDGLPDMYVKADSPSAVKNSLRKVVKNPEMIRNVERIAKASLQKMFRDKAAGKDEVSEDLELEEGYNDPIHRKYISDTVHEYVSKDDPKHEKIVDHLHKAKNFGEKTVDSLSDHAGISYGAAKSITKDVASNLKANFGTAPKTQTQAQRIGAYLKQKQIGPRK